VKDNGVICPMPFIQFSTTTMGNYQACCIAKQVDSMSFDNTTPMEFFNSDHMKQLRYDMANGVKSDLYNYTCSNCIIQEKLYNKSKRLDSLEHGIHGNLVSDKTLSSVMKEKDTSLEPKDIDHLKMKVFGNVCNLTCVMCYPEVSSALAAEMKKFGTLPTKFKGKTVFNGYKTIDKDKLYSELDVICPAIREFEIVGGEPLMMKDALEMIEWIISNGYSKNMEFRIITNATVSNLEFMSLMKYFKRATFIISLDGFGKKDEYIRTGTIWEEKINNIQ
jgi:sulfatase maturation enzyme AslB (radical SAM superfamily)